MDWNVTYVREGIRTGRIERPLGLQSDIITSHPIPSLLLSHRSMGWDGMGWDDVRSDDW